MSEPKATAPVTSPIGKQVTVYLDPLLWEAFKAVCEKNPKAKSASAQLQKAMLSEVRAKGRKYGVLVPKHLATK